MEYLIASDTPPKAGQRYFGDGKKFRHHCEVILQWAEKHKNESNSSITTISKDTGIPRMSVYWLIEDAKTRKQNSLLYKMARQHNYQVSINKRWNTIDKYKRRKNIISAYKK